MLALPPSMTLRMDADGIEIYADEITVAGGLLEHERDITLEGVRRRATMHDKLAVGDTVIVASLHDKMRYYVLDKAHYLSQMKTDL